MPNMKLMIPIAGSMVAAWLLGTMGTLALMIGSFSSLASFFLTVLIVAVAFGWWWYTDLRDQKAEIDRRHDQGRALPAYVLPEDVEALLDQHLQSVNAILDAAAMTMDVEGRLRARMREMAGYVTSIEDELEGLRVEADKVQEIKAVAARTPRLVSPQKTGPDDYGVRKQATDEPLPAFLKRDTGSIMPELESVLRSNGQTGPSEANWPAAAPLPAGG
jgi:hypothetical protein